jgi:hypothetical protein
MHKNRRLSLQGYTNTKPLGKSGSALLPRHIDSRQARLQLRSAKCRIDKVIQEDIQKVRHFLSFTMTCPRCSRTPATPQLPNHQPQSQHSLLPPSFLGPSSGSLKMTSDALLPFQQGQIAQSTPFGCSSGSLQ